MTILYPPCSAPDCNREARQLAQTYCGMHAHRIRRHGSLELKRIVTPPRARRGICIVDECEEIDEGAAGYCKKHATRVRKHGSPHIVHPVGSPAGPDHHSRNDAGLTYGGAHVRLRYQRGPAKRYVCVECGAPAKQWAYNHADPNERQSDLGPYSINPSFYDPKCVPCHKRSDLARLRAATA